VTFHPHIQLKSVTLQGDVYDARGTLTGGSAPKSSGIMKIIQQMGKLNYQIAENTKVLSEIKETMVREMSQIKKARELKNELELLRHQIGLTENEINSNTSSEIVRAVDDMRESLEKAKQDVIEAKSRHAEATQDVSRIEKDMNEFKNNKDGKLAQLEKTVERLKKDVSKKGQALKAIREQFEGAQVDSEQVGSDLAAANESLQEVDAAIGAQEADIVSIQKEREELQDSYEFALAELSDERARLSGFDNEVQALEEVTANKQAQIVEEGLEKQKLRHEVEKIRGSQEAASNEVSKMRAEHGWIGDEEDQFGLPGTPYDFSSIGISESRATLRKLTESLQGMKRKINPKVMNMIDSVEKKEIALKNNLRTVIKDKGKIEATVTELDRYKKAALETTHKKVSVDFGNIFAELLPGSFAKLVPLEGKEVSDGLEVKVQLGKVWKQSLTELSGGQRSLIALSLIMALLQFKPAPMYILDEVDAALDLSHTQNIGRLIKTRFKGSQFIVVSLKDGMFQNANKYVVYS
jgi:structural maintenance of chromosome 2